MDSAEGEGRTTGKLTARHRTAAVVVTREVYDALREIQRQLGARTMSRAVGTVLAELTRGRPAGTRKPVVVPWGAAIVPVIQVWYYADGLSMKAIAEILYGRAFAIMRRKRWSKRQTLRFVRSVLNPEFVYWRAVPAPRAHEATVPPGPRRRRGRRARRRRAG